MRFTSANARTLNPASRHVVLEALHPVGQTAVHLADPDQAHAFVVHVVPARGSTTRTPRRSRSRCAPRGMWRATRSPDPRPFWNAMTMLSGRSSGAMAAATASTSAALVAITQTSHGPASSGERPTWRLSTTKLPLAPETREARPGDGVEVLPPRVDGPHLVSGLARRDRRTPIPSHRYRRSRSSRLDGQSPWRMATVLGPLPTPMVSTTVSASVSMTDTVSPNGRTK